MQTEAPGVSAHVRGGHGWHDEAVGPRANVPAGQTKHVVPVRDSIVTPFASGVVTLQLGQAVTSIYAVDVSLEYMPAPQAVQSISNCNPIDVENFPELQYEQFVSLGAPAPD